MCALNALGFLSDCVVHQVSQYGDYMSVWGIFVLCLSREDAVHSMQTKNLRSASSFNLPFDSSSQPITTQAANLEPFHSACCKPTRGILYTAVYFPPAASHLGKSCFFKLLGVHILYHIITHSSPSHIQFLPSLNSSSQGYCM